VPGSLVGEPAPFVISEEVARVRARDIMRPARVVRPDDPADELIQAFEDPDLRAVAVVTDEGDLVGLVTDEDLLYALLPSYVLEDEALAGVLEERAGSTLRERIEGKRVRDVVKTTRREDPPVDSDDTLVEVAVSLVRSGHPAVLVAERGRVLGVITVDVLLPALLGSGRA
jgi:CBS-domain-containing membrane protein